MNKLISDNCWFGCDWVIYEVDYLGLRAGQLSPACAVVYLWNTGYLRVTRPRSYPGIQQLELALVVCVEPPSALDDESPPCPCCLTLTLMLLSALLLLDFFQ